MIYRSIIAALAGSIALGGCSQGTVLGSNDSRDSARTVSGSQEWHVTSLLQSAMPSFKRTPSEARTALVYVAGGYGVSIYRFPNLTTKPIGTLDIKAVNVCSGANGNVWFAVNSPYNELVEYKHGGVTPIHTIALGDIVPSGCVVGTDSKSIAVLGSSNGIATLMSYQSPNSSPKTYTDASILTFVSGAFDSQGNLLLAGTTNYDLSGLAELAKGGTALRNVSSRQVFERLVSLCWDGRHFVFGQQGDGSLQQYELSNGKLRYVGSVGLEDSKRYWLLMFALDGTNAVILTSRRGDFDKIAVYPYPAGSPWSHRHAFEEPAVGVAISLAS